MAYNQSHKQSKSKKLDKSRWRDRSGNERSRVKYCMFVLIVVIALWGETLGSQVDLKDRVALQVDRIRSISGSSGEGSFELPGVTLPNDSSPILELINYGMDAIPYLIPYLSDTSPTQAYRTHGGGMKRRAVVNEYVIFIIQRIADHIFYLPPKLDSPLPTDIAELEQLIGTWWQENRTKSLLERKIEDLNDPMHRNRFSVYEWLGRTKAKEGRKPLEQRIKVLLTGQVDTLKQSEMTACSESLAQIGDSNSAPSLRKVCDHLSYWIYMSYRPEDEGRSGSGSDQIARLFQAHKALASLGFKDEALSRLEELKSKYLAEMEASAQEEFLKQLHSAIAW
jgi:hypothetical protein